MYKRVNSKEIKLRSRGERYPNRIYLSCICPCKKEFWVYEGNIRKYYSKECKNNDP